MFRGKPSKCAFLVLDSLSLPELVLPLTGGFQTHDSFSLPLVFLNEILSVACWKLQSVFNVTVVLNVLTSYCKMGINLFQCLDGQQRCHMSWFLQPALGSRVNWASSLGRECLEWCMLWERNHCAELCSWPSSQGRERLKISPCNQISLCLFVLVAGNLRICVALLIPVSHAGLPGALHSSWAKCGRDNNYLFFDCSSGSSQIWHSLSCGGTVPNFHCEAAGSCEFAFCVATVFFTL